MFLHRRYLVLWLRCWDENWFFFSGFRHAGAWPAGEASLAESKDGWRCNRDAALIEPLGNLAITPMFAAQREDGFAVRFELAARPARHFIFGLWLQIHFAVTFLRPIILSGVAQQLRNGAAFDAPA